MEYFHHRPTIIEQKIKETWSPPMYLNDFLTEEDIGGLKVIEEIEHSAPNDSYQSTGYNITDARLDLKYPLMANIVNRLRNVLAYPFDVKTCWILHMNKNFPVHTDSPTDKNELNYKQCAATFRMEPESSESNLVLFKQRTLGHKTWFAKNSISSSEFNETGCYNLHTSYDHLIEFNADKPFSKEIYERILNHIKYSNLDGLTLDRTIKNKRGRIIIWDACQLHASNNWQTQDIPLSKKSHLLLELLRR